MLTVSVALTATQPLRRISFAQPQREGRLLSGPLFAFSLLFHNNDGGRRREVQLP